MEFIILAGNLHSAISQVVENKFIHVKDSKIVKIGEIGEENKSIEIWDFRDFHITPGLIDAHSHIGLYYESYYGEQKMVMNPLNH